MKAQEKILTAVHIGVVVLQFQPKDIQKINFIHLFFFILLSLNTCINSASFFLLYFLSGTYKPKIKRHEQEVSPKPRAPSRVVFCGMLASPPCQYRKIENGVISSECIYL